MSDPDPDEIDEDKAEEDDDEEDAKQDAEADRPDAAFSSSATWTASCSELREHVHVFDVEKKSGLRRSPSGPYDDSDPVWSPDGQSIAFVSNRTPDPDANRNTDIFVVAPAAATPSPAQLTTAPTEASDPSWSPDGRLIAYVEGGDPADMYYAVYHLSVVPAAGGESRPLTKHLDQNPGSFTTRPRFSADGKLLYFLLEDRRQRPSRPHAGWREERSRRSWAASGSSPPSSWGRRASSWSSRASPIIRRRSPSSRRPGSKRLTHVNDEVLRGLKLGTVTRHVAKSADGTEIDYFLTRPPDAPAGQKLPAILRIHGGPVSQFQNEFDFEWQALAANGYLVIAANPRGSSGRGRDFARAIWADWGGKDFEDVMAAVDAAVAQGAADPDRLGRRRLELRRHPDRLDDLPDDPLQGGHRGRGHRERPRRLRHRPLPVRVRGRAGPALEERRRPGSKLSKPFLEADKIKTPTLFLCGEVDWNVPLINSEQMYQALRRLDVPTELVVYPGESHSIDVPSYQKDRLERYVAWFDRT